MRLAFNRLLLLSIHQIDLSLSAFLPLSVCLVLNQLYFSPLFFSNYFHFLTFPLGSFCEQYFTLYDIQLTFSCYLILSLLSFVYLLLFFYFFSPTIILVPGLITSTLDYYYFILSKLCFKFFYIFSLCTHFQLILLKHCPNHGIWNLRKLPLLSFVVSGNNR